MLPDPIFLISFPLGAQHDVQFDLYIEASLRQRIVMNFKIYLPGPVDTLFFFNRELLKFYSRCLTQLVFPLWFYMPYIFCEVSIDYFQHLSLTMSFIISPLSFWLLLLYASAIIFKNEVFFFFRWDNSYYVCRRQSGERHHLLIKFSSSKTLERLVKVKCVEKSKTY